MFSFDNNFFIPFIKPFIPITTYLFDNIYTVHHTVRNNQSGICLLNEWYHVIKQTVHHDFYNILLYFIGTAFSHLAGN